MRRFLGLFVILVPSVVFSQVAVNKTKKEIMAAWKADSKVAARCKSPFVASDSTLSIKIACPGQTSYTRYTYRFDKTGKCQSEKIAGNGDSTMKEALTRVLAIESYNWQKINENQYVSDFDSRLMVEFPPDNTEHSFTILRMDWSHELYDLLMKK